MKPAPEVVEVDSEEDSPPVTKEATIKLGCGPTREGSKKHE